MMYIRQALEKKGHDVWSVTPHTTVFDALKILAEKNIGALLVLDQGTLAGIFSERDYARKVVLKGKTSKETPVSDIMTADVHSVDPSQSIVDCMALMTEKHIRHLPVMEENNVVGLISIGDVVKCIISEQEDTIRQLESYIVGGR